jgi:CheY-like chemotaxis protein
MANQAATGDAANGILYFDPNPTTAKLATAGLQLAGYRVYNAASQEKAVALCRQHGPAGDGSIIALLLDSATAPAVSASVLRALVQVPGASDLPGILLVSRANPTPIPGAEGLPSLKRPFTIPALLKVLREAVDIVPRGAGSRAPPSTSEALKERVASVLAAHWPGASVPGEVVAAIAGRLVVDSELPTPAHGVTLTADLAATRLESVLDMLAKDGVRGVVTVDQGERVWGRLHIDEGAILMSEVRGIDEDLRLGRFVVEAGFMAADKLDAVAAASDPMRRLLGQRLVDDGHLRPGELTQVLAAQSREVTCQLLGWATGRVSFAPTSTLHPLASEAAKARAGLRIAEALLDGLRRLSEAAQMGPHMAGVDDVYIRVDLEVAKLGRHAFTREELGVLELLNGRNSVKEVARKTRTGTFAVTKIIYRLTRAALARRREDPALA